MNALFPTARFSTGSPSGSRRNPVSFAAAMAGLLLSLAVVAITACGGGPSRLVIGVASLPVGQVGSPYNATLSATGGKTPYTWTLTSGTLPAGLQLNATTGAITGIPTVEVKAAELTFALSDSSKPPQGKSATLSLTIGPVPLVITTTSLPGGVVGTPYNATLSATGGTAPYKWSLGSGGLPAGLQLNSATGAITGTPALDANATQLTFTVADSDSSPQTKSATLPLTIAPIPLAITTASLPNGMVGTPYSATLTATGGTAPYSWSVTSGGLPAGLILNSAMGTITGTPTEPANAASLTFTLTDASSPIQVKAVALSLTVAPAPLAITTSSLPVGTVGTSYSATLAATGGTLPFTWALTSGSLPAGLSLNASSGTITGSPTLTANAIPLTFSLTDSSSPVQTKSVVLAMTIVPAPLAITTISLPGGTVGSAYSATLAGSGGTTPYVWSLTGGTLPTGLSLNSATGAITGTPSVPASALSLTFTLTDSGSPAQAKTVTLTLTIVPLPLSIRTSSLPSGEVATPYSATLKGSGGTLPYTWTLTSGTLPGGLTLNAATGLISGNPTEPISADSLTFTLTDSGTPVQTQSVVLSLTIAIQTVEITTTSLPSGQVGTPYSATLTAVGGTLPYQWSLTSGTLPPGLSLNAATGAITGTPSSAPNDTGIGFTVSDSTTPVQHSSVSLTLTISSASGISVSLTPLRAGLVTSQTLAVTPTTNDTGGVHWSVSGASCSGASCGTLSVNSSLPGVAVTYTAPAAPGLYTLTATSVADGLTSASVSIAVTDLNGVTTYHNNLSRNGANTQEYALSPSTVTSTTFGQLFSCTVDGAVYAQPLWVPNLTIGSAKHNVVFVATQHDSLYAFDADNNTTPCVPLWQVSLIDAAHGGTPGETSVPSSGTGKLVGHGTGGDIAPEVGVTGTPVIDLTTDTLYVVSKSVIASSLSFYQRLHAIDLLTGSEKFSGPVTIAATFPGTGDGGTTTTFVAGPENQRAGLALANGTVYIAWASHEDTPSYYGWVIGYNAANLSEISVFNDDPNGGYGGIWMSGGAPAMDSSNNIYFITGNGLFDAANSTPPTNDYGDSFLKLTSGLSVSQYFAPSDESSDEANDRDFGSGGAVVLVDLPANGLNPTHLVIGGGKDGYLYLLNRDKLGGAGDSNAWQRIYAGSGIFATGAFWNSNFYLAGNGGKLQDFSLNQSTAKLNILSTASAATFGFPGSTPSVSSMPDMSNGIVWALDESQYCTPSSPGCGPAVLHAYDATNLVDELWNSAQNPADAAGYAVKFTVPTVANGKVYVGTRGNSKSSPGASIPGGLTVYGLLPN